jgi:hypothetical protein
VAEKLFAIVLDTNSQKKVLYAPSELDREEWINVVRKYSAQSNIENAYEIPRDANSKLGEGSDLSDLA